MILARAKENAPSAKGLQGVLVSYGISVDKAVLLERMWEERKERQPKIDAVRGETLADFLRTAIEALDVPGEIHSQFMALVVGIGRQAVAGEQLVADTEIAKQMNAALRAHFKATIRAEIVREWEADLERIAAEEAAAPPEADVVEEEPEEAEVVELKPTERLLSAAEFRHETAGPRRSSS